MEDKGRRIEVKDMRAVEVFNVKTWEIFKDRTVSLLERWDKFVKEHPEVPDVEISAVRGCIAEISDDFTKMLIGE